MPTGNALWKHTSETDTCSACWQSHKTEGFTKTLPQCDLPTQTWQVQMCTCQQPPERMRAELKRRNAVEQAVCASRHSTPKYL